MLQFPQSTTVCAWLKTVVIWKHPGHLMSMKNEFGDCTSRLSLWVLISDSGVGLRRSTGILAELKETARAKKSRIMWEAYSTKTFNRDPRRYNLQTCSELPGFGSLAHQRNPVDNSNRCDFISYHFQLRPGLHTLRNTPQLWTQTTLFQSPLDRYKNQTPNRHGQLTAAQGW